MSFCGNIGMYFSFVTIFLCFSVFDDELTLSSGMLCVCVRTLMYCPGMQDMCLRHTIILLLRNLCHHIAYLKRMRILCVRTDHCVVFVFYLTELIK